VVRTKLLAILLLAAAPALAAPKADPQAEREAKTLFAEGNRLLAAGDAQGALGMYRSAYERFPNPKLLLNIGTALRQLGRNAEAADAYERYLRESGFDAKRAAEATKILGELEPLVGRVRIETTPPGATVAIDGKAVGVVAEPKVVRVEPGSHTFSAELRDHEPVNVAVKIARGEELPVRIALKALPPPPPPPPLEPVAPLPVAPAPSPEALLEVEGGFEPEPLSHAGHLALTARSETDVRELGTGSAFGVAVGVGQIIELSGLALIQRDVGMRVAATAWLMPDAAVKPLLRLGIPVFFTDDGAKAGIHAGGGAIWDLSERYGLGLDLAVEHFPGAPDARHKTAAVLGAGLHVRVY
jgi:hypothetical protein